ncbi:MAG: redoxin domain-containing protein [Paludibacter sp.]|nr:redoxin domain-containing protein [Paludibacter sp.]
MSNRFWFFILIPLSLLFLSNTEIKAQSGKLPPFSILQPNGKNFRAQNLPFEKPIIVIYFSPDCEDCLAFMDKFFKRANDFSKASIVMISYFPIKDVKKFAMKYKIANYKNITVGTEGTSFFIKDYYKIMELPFLALYDKDGNIQISYQRNIPLNELSNKLMKLR